MVHGMKKAVALAVAGAATLVVAGWRRVQRDNSIATDPPVAPKDPVVSPAAKVDPGAVGTDPGTTKAELYEIARDLDVEGRSNMNKAELLRAIRNAG